MKPQLPKNVTLYPAEKTLTIEIDFFKTFLKWASEQGLRGNKPHPKYRLKSELEITRPPFNDSDYRKMFRSVLTRAKLGSELEGNDTHRLLLYYVNILLLSGMRVGEANSLLASDVTAKDDRTKDAIVTFLVRGKTGTREIVARTKVRKFITPMIELRKQAAPSKYFFPMKNGAKITTLADQFNAALKAGGVERNDTGEKYCLYSLRHNYALDMLRQNVSHYQLAENMGTRAFSIQSASYPAAAK